MTRNPPEGQGQYSYGSQYGQGHPLEQQQGNYDYSQQQPQGGYGGYNEGSAQGYYGSNNEPYQQYPEGHPPQHHNQPLQGYNQSGYRDQQYGAPPPSEQYGQGYGQQPYSSPPPGPPQQSGYGQEYPHQYMQQPSGEVANFRSQFDHPNAPPNQYGHYGQVPTDQYPPTGAPPGPEGERGIMGALAGGAAGAWGGHQVHHGVLGGIGGAVAGSMVEDAYKKHNKQEKKHDKHGSRPGSSSSDSSSDDSDHRKHHHHGGAPAGNFHASSRNVYLEEHCTLVANCADPHGHHHRSALDLNDCLTNTNGSLHWARGGNFAASARHIRLKHDGRVLEAELGDGSGGWRHNEIELNEKITNDNGRLVML